MILNLPNQVKPWGDSPPEAKGSVGLSHPTQMLGFPSKHVRQPRVTLEKTCEKDNMNQSMYKPTQPAKVRLIWKYSVTRI